MWQILFLPFKEAENAFYPKSAAHIDRHVPQFPHATFVRRLTRKGKNLSARDMKKSLSLLGVCNDTDNGIWR